MSKDVRIDSFLWAVRIFKTRSIAQDACKKGRVSINNIVAKPAKMVSEGDTISVRKPPVAYTFKVLKTATNRMNAKLVPEFLENITPPEVYEALQMQRLSGYIDRSKGLGRPTKKERRDLEQFYENSSQNMGFLEEDWEEETNKDSVPYTQVSSDWLNEEEIWNENEELLDNEDWDNW